MEGEVAEEAIFVASKNVGMVIMVGGAGLK